MPATDQVRVGYAIQSLVVLIALGGAACGGRLESIPTCGSSPSQDAGACGEPGPDAAAYDGSSTLVDAHPGDASTFDAATAPVDLDAACASDENTFYIAGDDFVHKGLPLTIQGGVGWKTETFGFIGGKGAGVYTTFGSWHADFSTKSLGKSLSPGTYVDAQREPFTDPNHPGLDVGGNGFGCNKITGSFTILDVDFSDAGVVTNFRVQFDQHCEGGSSHNVGCLHVRL